MIGKESDRVRRVGKEKQNEKKNRRNDEIKSEQRENKSKAEGKWTLKKR